MTPLRTRRLILRNWREGDRELFHRINSDDAVMEFFPFRRSREQADQLMDWLAQDIGENGYGFAAIEMAATGETAGFCGLANTSLEPHVPAGSVEIGWRLDRPWWGKGIASEAAREWLRAGFEDLGLHEIWSFAVKDNHRSLAVMERLGMRRAPERDFLHPRIPPEMPHLAPHSVYTITSADWKSRGGK